MLSLLQQDREVYMMTPNESMVTDVLSLEEGKRNIGRMCFMVLLMISASLLGGLVLGWIEEASSAPYLNSSEPICNGSDPTVLMCDDFEDGDWAQTNDRGNRDGVHITDTPQTYAPNDGWGCTAFDVNPPNFAATNNFVVTGGAGGTGKAATSGPRTNQFASGNDGGGQQCMHGLPGNYTEVYIRYYLRNHTDYVVNSDYDERMLDTVPVDWNPCGNCLLGDLHNKAGSGQLAAISYHFQDNGFAGCPSFCWLFQNQVNGMGTDSRGNSTPTGGPITLQTGHWYYIEMHIRVNTGINFDGLYDLWVDDCGTNGQGCTGPGTLRTKYTTMLWWTDVQRALFGGSNIRGFWIQNYANPHNAGSTQYDQIVVRTQRVGPMAVGGATTPPTSPTNLRVQ